MFRTVSHVAVLALALGALTGAVQASDILDHSNSGSSASGSPFASGVDVTSAMVGASPTNDSNSASATGSPYTFTMPTSVATVGANPTNDSNSASATGNPYTFTTPTSIASIGANPANDSNSASALGGPGTGVWSPLGRTAPMARADRSLPATQTSNPGDMG